jgi:uncharacterized protein GlcG (DUF336 family)
MDGALLVAAGIAEKKAITAVEFQTATRELNPLVQPGGPLYGIEAAAGGRLVVFGGGIPLTDDGRVVGGVGISGGSPEEDHDVAAAGAAAF